MTIVRKLRTLQRKGSSMDAKLVVSKTRKYLQTIGERCAGGRGEPGGGGQARAGQRQRRCCCAACVAPPAWLPTPSPPPLCSISEACEGDTDLRHSLWEFVSQYTGGAGAGHGWGHRKAAGAVPTNGAVKTSR